MRNRVNWKALLDNGEHRPMPNQKRTKTTNNLMSDATFKLACQLVPAAVAAEGLILALLTLCFGKGWIIGSPLLNAAGGALALVLLCISLLIGVVLWCITGASTVVEWAFGLFPFGAQPPRSALGVLVVFALLALVAQWIMPRLRADRELAEVLCIVLAVILLVTMLVLVVSVPVAVHARLADALGAEHTGDSAESTVPSISPLLPQCTAHFSEQSARAATGLSRIWV